MALFSRFRTKRQTPHRAKNGKASVDDFAGMDACAVDGSAKEVFSGDNAVAVVEVDAQEHFMLESGEAERQVLACGSRTVQQRTPRQPRHHNAEGGGEPLVRGMGLMLGPGLPQAP